jgi:cytosine/adenosine deaminase-related metal-dependent hydrolase
MTDSIPSIPAQPPVSVLVIDRAAIATVDAAGTEYAIGHLVAEDGWITAVGPGPAPSTVDREARVVDGAGCLLTPGLVNTHHHLYQWVTRGYAVDSTLFEWLTELYPVWARISEQTVHAAATAGLAWLARSGCTTTTDHHYLFPRVDRTSGERNRDQSDLLGSTVDAASRVGMRFHPTRGSMDLGRSHGGLPPDEVVESIDDILAASEAAVARFHDPSPGAMVRVALAPCSPFSVTGDLLSESAKLARSLGVRLHTHIAETLDEEAYCQKRYGCGPVEYLDRLGWLGADVWLAHGVHLDPGAIARLAATGTGVAHCPSSNARLGAGTAPVRALLDASVPVGLGVDGAASHEAGRLVDEVRQAVYAARSRVDGGGVTDPQALSVRQALWIATMGGAQCLGRGDEIGSLEVGKVADLALWRVDGLGHAGIADPVAALVLGSAPPLDLLAVGGRVVVEHDRLATLDEAAVADDLRRACEEVRG